MSGKRSVSVGIFLCTLLENFATETCSALTASWSETYILGAIRAINCDCTMVTVEASSEVEYLAAVQCTVQLA